MASLTLDGTTYEYLLPDPGHSPEDARSWEYGSYPKVMAAHPLAVGAAVDIYALANRWLAKAHGRAWNGGNHGRSPSRIGVP
ncbi:MAG: hypothetical protein ABWX85_09235 [Arthrobacter sp.]